MLLRFGTAHNWPMTDMKTPIILVPIAVIYFLTTTLVRVENERYALFLGMCKSPLWDLDYDPQCLKTVQTRTSWLWHVAFAVDPNFENHLEGLTVKIARIYFYFSGEPAKGDASSVPPRGQANNAPCDEF